MANRCTLEVHIPITDITDETQRLEIQAYFEAEQEWRKEHESGRGFSWKERSEFIANYPGVPSQKTQDRHVESEQYLIPAISPEFSKRNGVQYACIEEGLKFVVPNQKSLFGGANRRLLDMVWHFKHSFPWWAQVGFAGGEKHFGKIDTDEPDGRGWLVWEQPIDKMVSNLADAVAAYEELPVSFELWEWLWAAKELSDLEAIYRWMARIKVAAPNSIVQLDWSEVGWNVLGYERIEADDHPNLLMKEIEEMKRMTDCLNRGEIEEDDFREKYADRRFSNFNDQGYLKILDRELFKFWEL